MITINLSVAEAIWGVQSLKKIGFGAASEGIGLPAALASVYHDYLKDVKGLTPPASGGTVGTLAYSKGKAAITIDLHKAFNVVLKSGGVKSGRILMAFNAALDWYLKNRKKNGRFSGTIRQTVDLSTFLAIERALHQRIGWLRAGWNAACNKFQVPIESWVKNKNAPGTVTVLKQEKTVVIQARNNVRFASRIKGLQANLNRAAFRRVREVERKAKAEAEEKLRKAFK